MASSRLRQSKRIPQADIAAALWHPHIVRVHDRGEHDGQLWITMDFVEGTDVAQLMRDRYPHGMPTNDVLEIVAAVADALDYAHERYLLHRDVKPANILITDPRPGDRRILLADFGIARATNDTSGLTATSMTVGSVAYAAPEQLMGTALDSRADKYALACMAFHLLTGQSPFENSNPAVVIGTIYRRYRPGSNAAALTWLRSTPYWQRRWPKNRLKRFATCRDFAESLAQCEQGTVSPTADTQLAARSPSRSGTTRVRSRSPPVRVPPRQRGAPH